MSQQDAEADAGGSQHLCPHSVPLGPATAPTHPLPPPPHLSNQTLTSYRFHFSGMFVNGVTQHPPVGMLFSLLTLTYPYPV
jgi:hypothetical protein